MLLERAGEQAGLREALAGARRGDGRAVVIEGEAGIGKTALLDWLAHESATGGATVLTACGAELEREYAFGVARQLFGIAPPAQADEFAALNALFWFADGATVDHPAVLVVDDAHWADAPSRRFLAFLARRLDGMALALVIARRVGEPALELDRIAASGRVLRPRALSVAAAEQLAGDAALGAACHHATGGNPFLLRALLDDLERAPAGERLPRAHSTGPAEVRRAILLRLAALPPAATALAHAVAVAGDGVRPADAALLAGVPAPAAAIDGLVRARILSERLEFIHPVVRHAVYADIPPGTRATLHRRAAHALAAAGAAPERIAAHWLAVPPGDAGEAVALLRAAADAAAARGAPDVAARYLRRALAETPNDPDLLLAGGRQEVRAGDPAAAGHLKAALELGTDPELRTNAALALAELVVTSGCEVADTIAALAAELEATHPELALRLDAELMTTRTMQGHMPPRLAARLATAATLTGDSAGARSLLAAASMELAGRGGPADEAAALAERALTGGPDPLATRTHFFALLTLMVVDRLDRALALMNAAVLEAQASGNAQAFAIVSAFRSRVHYRAGRVRDAEADARTSLAAYPDWHGRPEVIASLVAPLRERGELDEAEALIGDAVAVASPFLTITLNAQRGFVALARGDACALAHFQAAGDVAERIGVRGPTFAPWRSGAALALGSGEEAVALAQAELDLARSAGLPSAEATALRALGLVGRRELRLERLEGAVALAGQGPARLELARCLLALGAARHRAGQRTAARQVLQDALDLAHRCGATVLADQARELLIRTGARPRRARLTGVDALTASERRTVEMAAGGLTNREIARALFVTPKTVEAHLTRAYVKLGVHRREELAAVLSPPRASDRAGGVT